MPYPISSHPPRVGGYSYGEVGYDAEEAKAEDPTASFTDEKQPSPPSALASNRGSPKNCRGVPET